MKKSNANKSRSPSGERRAKKKPAANQRPGSGKRPRKAPARSRPPVSKGGSKKSSIAARSPAVKRKPTAEEIAHQQAMERFESALELFSHNHWARARAMFERLTANSSPELAERAGVYVRICDQRLSRATLQLKTAEDYYNYAVGLANEGNAEESEEYLLKALKLSPKCDYLYYALATTCAMRDDVQGALEYLLKAIALNERNRFQAQNDPDFANLLEDPRFTELLYPEKPLT